MLQRPLARRTTLLMSAAMAGLATSACTSDSPDDPTDPSDPASTSGPPVDADQELVTTVAAHVAAAGVFVDRLSRDFPALRSELGHLQALHRAHLEAIGGFDGSIPAPQPVTVRPEAARKALLRREKAVQRALTEAAIGAESGTLAKLLASMSAGVAQQLAVLA